MGHWLGVSHRVGHLMSYWVLTQKGNVISCTTISRVTNLETQVDSTKSRLQEFDTAITDRLNDEAHIIIEGGKSQPYDWSNHPFDEDFDFVDEFHSVVSNSTIHSSRQALGREGDVKPPLGGNSWHNGKMEVQTGYH